MAIGRLFTRTLDNDGYDLVRPPHETPSQPTRVWGWLEHALFLVGIVSLGYFAYAVVETQLYQAFENRELDAILASGPPSAPLPRLPRPAPGTVIGRIEIPRLDVSAVIRSGSDARTLKLAVGHIPGTALPGETGNIGLAGHRDTFFRRLRDIQESDEIRIVTTSGTFDFTVARTNIVRPKDTWVLSPTRTAMLTLVTCYPFTYIGAAPERFIVRAVAPSTIAKQ